MKDKDIYYKLTGENLHEYKTIKHTFINYVDDTQHVVSGNSH